MNKTTLGLVLCFTVGTVFAAPHAIYKKANTQDIQTTAVNTSTTVVNPFQVKAFLPGIVVGRFGAAFDYKLNNRVAVGALLRTLSQSDQYDEYLNTYGLELEYATNGDLNKNGWILNPVISTTNYRFHDGFPATDGLRGDQSNKIDKEQTSNSIGLNLIYQWTWKAGIYIQAGFGGDYSTNPNSNMYRTTNTKFAGNADLAVGYQF